MNYNLGSGTILLKDYKNLDKKDLDLNKDISLSDLPDNKETIMYNIVEHLDNPYKTIIEIGNTMKKGSILKIKTPTFFSSPSIVHKQNLFNDRYFRMLCGYNPETCDGINMFKEIKIKYMRQKKFIGFAFIDFLIKIKRFILSMWNREIYFEFEKNYDYDNNK